MRGLGFFFGCLLVAGCAVSSPPKKPSPYRLIEVPTTYLLCHTRQKTHRTNADARCS